MTVFIDSSLWFAAIVAADRHNDRAKESLSRERQRLTTDHVVIETWLLLNSRYRRDAAEQFWAEIRRGIAEVHIVTADDLEAAWAIGEVFADQLFSIVHRTSFVVMERLGIARAASFDDDFLIYRFGPDRKRAFEIVR